MKKLLAIAALCLLSGSAFAQQSVEAQVKDLKAQVTTLQSEVQGLSQRLASVEQLNITLRKALNFGQPITTATGKYGVTYNLLSIVGNKQERTIKATFQAVTSADESRIQYTEGAAITDVNGNRVKTYEITVGGDVGITLYKDVPTNGEVLFNDVNVESTQAIKLLKMAFTNGSISEVDHIQFRDLKVDWR